MENPILKKKSIQMRQYSEEFKEDWDNFIENSALNSTFLHSRKFFDHNNDNALDDASLLFLKEDKIIAVFPAVLYQRDSEIVLHSHSRATYGGFIVNKKVGVEEALDIVEQTILFARERKAVEIVVRNPFRIFHQTLCDETDYAMWYHGFEIKSRELEIAVSLEGDINALKSKYHNDAARNVKKAWKNLEVKPIVDLEEFWQLLERCQMERHGKQPVHDYASICRLINVVGKDKVLTFGAYYGDRLIGGCVVFKANNLVLHGQYIASDYDYQYLKPIHALIDYMLEYGNKESFKYFNFGMANEDEGRKINYGLFSIKEHFGGRGLLRETMRLNVNQYIH